MYAAPHLHSVAASVLQNDLSFTGCLPLAAVGMRCPETSQMVCSTRFSVIAVLIKASQYSRPECS